MDMRDVKSEEKLLEKLDKNNEVSAEELDNVSGGLSFYDIKVDDPSSVTDKICRCTA